MTQTYIRVGDTVLDTWGLRSVILWDNKALKAVFDDDTHTMLAFTSEDQRKTVYETITNELLDEAVRFRFVKLRLGIVSATNVRTAVLDGRFLTINYYEGKLLFGYDQEGDAAADFAKLHQELNRDRVREDA